MKAVSFSVLKKEITPCTRLDSCDLCFIINVNAAQAAK